MDLSGFRLHRLSLSLRVAVTCLILVVAGGMLASFLHLRDHYRNKDEQPALTMDDIIGSFHGMHQPARMITALEGEMHRHLPWTEVDGEEVSEEYNALMKWLKSDRISEYYDALELGDFAPAEIIALNCLGCHARGAEAGNGVGERVPLENWDDVKKVAFSKNLDPVPLEILTTSTHTHALTMPLVGLAAALLFLATGWPRLFRHGVIMLSAAALLADVGSWWLARQWAPGCYVIVAAGGLFGTLVSLQLLLAFLETWLGGIFKKS